MKWLYIPAITVMTMLLTAPASAEEWEKYDKPVPTKVLVRVLSHGAKAMSEHVGAVIVIRETDTGTELARNPVQGSTGDDIALMRAAYPRISGKTGAVAGDKGILLDASTTPGKTEYYDIRSGKGPEGTKPVLYESKTDTAMYLATLNITKPTRIVIDAYGPLMPEHSMNSASASTLVFPGEDIEGEGIVLDLRGLIVDTLASMKDAEVNADAVKDGIPVAFYMRMMCGCPIAPAEKGLPWQTENYAITVQAYYKGKLYHEDSTTSDKLFVDTSFFKTTVPLPKDLPAGSISKERVKIRIMAAQREQANFGMDEFDVYLSRR